MLYMPKIFIFFSQNKTKIGKCKENWTQFKITAFAFLGLLGTFQHKVRGFDENKRQIKIRSNANPILKHISHMCCIQQLH